MLDARFFEHERYFVHKDTQHLIEFPSGPLSVGDTPVNNIAEIDTESGVLRLLTATDCVKDRLAAYYHWDDEPSLHQAVWVAQHNEVDIESIKAWSKREKSMSKFDAFLAAAKKP